MKKFLCALMIVSSFSSVVYAESQTGNSRLSYTDAYGGTSSGTTHFSEASQTSLREQINANKASVAAFIQSNDIDSQDAEVKEIVENARQAMHAEINAMSDRDVLERVLSK